MNVILLKSPKVWQINDFPPCPIGARVYMGLLVKYPAPTVPMFLVLIDVQKCQKRVPFAIHSVSLKLTKKEEFFQRKLPAVSYFFTTR